MPHDSTTFVDRNVSDAERWLPIGDWPGYDVSDFGRVRSSWGAGLVKGVGRGRRTLGCDWKLKAQATAKSGHKMVSLTRNHTRDEMTFRVHRLVLEAFVGPCPEGMECCHNDGNPANNHVSNLRWDTNQSNQIDKLKHGVSGVAKLGPDDIPAIWSRLVAGESGAKIGRDYLVSTATISMIRSGVTWSHITSQLQGSPTSSGNAKLTEAEVRLIWGRLVAGETGADLARDFRVSSGTISLIRSGDIWSHVTSQLPGWPLVRRGAGGKRLPTTSDLNALKYM